MSFIFFPLKRRVILVKNRITLFLFLFLCFSGSNLAQSYYFDQYSVQEGLAQSKVYDVIQDDEGYVWLGTEAGISRFDGKDFVNYNTDHGIAEKAVRVIFKDSNGNLWFGHNTGNITYYDGEKFSIHPISDSIDAKFITSIVQDNEGKIWISSEGDGIFMFEDPPQLDTNNLKFEHFKGEEVGDRIFGSTILENDSLYFIIEATIKKYDPGKKVFEKFHPEGLTNYFQITSMMQDSRGDIWFGTFHGGLFRYYPDEDRFKIYDSKRDGIANNFISCIKEDSRGDVWVGTWGGGISRFSGGEITTFNESNGLIDEKIYTIEEDVEGNILIGTYEHGLLIFKGGKFITYGEKDGLRDPHVWSIYQDHDSNYWFGTNEGITIFDPEAESGNKTRYFNKEDNMIGNQVRQIVEDQDGNVWIGTIDNGLIQYLTNSGEFFYNPLLNRPLRQYHITAMEVDRNNILWIGTVEGIFQYDIATREIEYKSQQDGLAGNTITALYEDKNGVMWIGSEYKGLTRAKDDDFKSISIDENLTPTSIIEDNSGNIWIGTKTKGLYFYQDDSLKLKYNKKDGLLSDQVTLLNVDYEGNIYVGTNQGVNKIVKPGEKIYVYTEKSGFTGIETKDKATLLDEEGNVWFGTVKGAIKYKPELEPRNPMEPLTHIESMLVNMKRRPLTGGQKFNYTENSIIFNYNSICLSNPDAVKYQIMLKGSDKDWRPVTDQTMVNYSSLSPGEYTFMVKARNDAGVWNNSPATYNFIIKPPFYKTWWFIIGVIILGIIGIVVFVKVRERNLRREKQVLEQKVAERTKEISLKNTELSKKNSDIMDSIRYAQRIQDAVLPPEIPFEKTFILFKPKDIVSGDFYWMEKVNGKELMAAVDCTGHGVPGAFLSILGHNLLNKIVREYGILETDKILDKLNSEVLDALHQSNKTGEKVVNDGMDLALVSYDTENNILSYSGAYNSLYFVRDGELTEYKANRFAIGRTTSVENKKFTSHQIEVQKGDTIYIFSDGYADQFGGPKGKKFKSKPLKEFLTSIQHMDIRDHKKALEQKLEEWKGDHFQVDDIVFIGKRF